jgi:LPS export ABC transporter protein LptC
MRSRYIDRAAGSLRLAMAVGTLLLVGSCGKQRAVSPAGSGEGLLLWKLYARYAATYNARNVVVARAVRVDFFDEKGERSSVLTAREGDLNQRTHNMTARGSVVLQTTEGTRLSTEELRFMNREQKVVVPVEQLVRVERSGDVLTGYGFESDPDLRHYEFKRRVEATVRSRSDDLANPPRGGR